jgi:hypothetical protein
MSMNPTYGTMSTRYGERVAVDGSSVAGTCWLRIDTAVNKNDHHGGERKDADALLTVAQAKILRASLDAFIEDCEGDEI